MSGDGIDRSGQQSRSGGEQRPPEALRLSVFEQEEWSDAVGLLIEQHVPATKQSFFIGPFAKDGAETLAWIERLRSEEEPGRDPNIPPIIYDIRLLFAPE